MNVAEMQSQTVATEYNEWSNYETWCINHWMNGDQGYCEQVCEILSSHDNLNDQTEALEDWVRFEYDGEYSNLWADLINNSLEEWIGARSLKEIRSKPERPWI